MTEQDRILTYIAGIYVVTLMGEWKKTERIGIKAKIYNTIMKKHASFHNQILQSHKKKKSCSRNSQLFAVASDYAVKGWEKAVKETKGLTISVSTTIRNLYNFNKENFTRLYGLTEDDFVKFDKEEGAGYKTFSSCKMGRILNECAKEQIYKKGELDECA